MVRSARWIAVFAVALVGLTPALCAEFGERGGPYISEKLALIVVGLAAVLALAAARRTAWMPTLVAAAVGTATGLGLISIRQVAVTTPQGESLAPKIIARSVPQVYGRIQRRAGADLVMLQKGLWAAESGRPLPAPEGGVLMPQEADPLPGIETYFRYVSASPQEATPAVWRRAISRQKEMASTNGLGFAIRETSGFGIWAKVGTVLLATSLVVAFLANLAALASRSFARGAR